MLYVVDYFLQYAIFKYFKTIGGILDYKFGMDIERSSNVDNWTQKFINWSLQRTSYTYNNI